MGFTETTFLFAFLPLSIIIYVLTDKLLNNVKISNVTVLIQ